MEILIVVGTIVIMIAQDFIRVKDPFDKELKEFNILTDWLQYRYDNLIGLIACGVVGGALSNEVGSFLLKEYINMSTNTEIMLHNTSVFVSTYLFGKYLPYLFKIKK